MCLCKYERHLICLFSLMGFGLRWPQDFKSWFIRSALQSHRSSGTFLFWIEKQNQMVCKHCFGQIMEKPLTVNVTRNNTEILWQCHNRYPWNPILCLRRSNTRRTTILFATPTICMTSLSRGNDVLLNSVRQRCSSDTFYILRKIVRKTIIESSGTGRVQNCAQVGTVQ